LVAKISRQISSASANLRCLKKEIADLREDSIISMKLNFNTG